MDMIVIHFQLTGNGHPSIQGVENREKNGNGQQGEAHRVLLLHTSTYIMT